MSRVEKILKVMLGRETKLPTPQSRVEELLIDLKTTYESSSGAISGLDSRLTTAETEIEGLKDDLDEEVANLAGDISENQDSIKANGTAIQTLQEQVARIQNPLIIKDIVDTLMGLPMEAEPGWVYFVRFTEEGSEHDQYEEFVYTTDSQWESLGPMKVDLAPYVKFTDYATKDKSGVVKFGESNNTGLTVDNTGVPSLATTDEAAVKAESNTSLALHPNNIPMFMSNYGIESKTFIADNYVKRIRYALYHSDHVYYKLMEWDTNKTNDAFNFTLLVTGGVSNWDNTPVYIVNVDITDINNNNKISVFKVNKTISNCEFSIMGGSLWVKTNSQYATSINCIILQITNPGKHSIQQIYDVQQTEEPNGFTKVPIETVTTSSDFATEADVTAMLTEVFDTSATALSDEEASDMEVLSYEE